MDISFFYHEMIQSFVKRFFILADYYGFEKEERKKEKKDTRKYFRDTNIL